MGNRELKERITYIDALRGLAVILMIEQHLGYWLWNHPRGAVSFLDYPFIISINALGGFAAPAFITLAGVGISLFGLRHTEIDKSLFFRGLMIIFFGYVLNIITPGWFSPGSWYVLHMIGFGIMISPLLRRMPDYMIFILFAIILIVTVILHNMLDTPFYMGTLRMRRLDLPGGALRLVLAEGQFPIFPWLCFFLTGIVSGRWLVFNKIKRIAVLAIIFLITGAVLSALYLFKIDFIIKSPLLRACRVHLGFYPASPAMVLILISLVLFSIVVFRAVGLRIGFSSRNPLVCLGRASLTLLMLHVVIFREMSLRFNYWQIFSVGETLSLIAAVLILFTFLVFIWQKYNYRYGTEWLLRVTA